MNSSAWRVLYSPASTGTSLSPRRVAPRTCGRREAPDATGLRRRTPNASPVRLAASRRRRARSPSSRCRRATEVKAPLPAALVWLSNVLRARCPGAPHSSRRTSRIVAVRTHLAGATGSVVAGMKASTTCGPGTPTTCSHDARRRQTPGQVKSGRPLSQLRSWLGHVQLRRSRLRSTESGMSKFRITRPRLVVVSARPEAQHRLRLVFLFPMATMVSRDHREVGGPSP